MPTLTFAQHVFLYELNKYEQRVIKGYRPALKLVELGYATMKNEPSPFGLVVTITDAGRAALMAPRERKKPPVT